MSTVIIIILLIIKVTTDHLPCELEVPAVLSLSENELAENVLPLLPVPSPEKHLGLGLDKKTKQV